MRILFSDVVLLGSGTETQLMRSPSIAEKFPLKCFFLFFFVLFFSFFCFCPASEKRSLRQRTEIADERISAEPSRDLSASILSVSLCLQFLWSRRSRPPALRPARLLLAVGLVVLGVSSLLPVETWQGLPVFVHAPAEAPLSALGRTTLEAKRGTGGEGRSQVR